jgi:hypothetical protein
VVQEGVLVVRNLAGLGTGQVIIGNGAALRLDVGMKLVDVSRLQLLTGGRIDVGVGGITLGAGTYDESALREALIAGRNGGNWSGAEGIMTAAAGTARGVGYSVSASGDATVRFTSLGDAQLDGKVDFDDIIALFPNYNAAGSYRWQEGDFTYDGKVDFDDIIALFPNYGAGGLFGASGSGLNGGGGGAGSSTGSGGTGAGGDSTTGATDDGAKTGNGEGQPFVGPEAGTGVAPSTTRLSRDDRARSSPADGGLSALNLAFAGLSVGGAADEGDL